MKTVALALGGGGARGLAHIVVAEALDEMGVKPVAIAGTSIGAHHRRGLCRRHERPRDAALRHPRRAQPHRCDAPHDARPRRQARAICSAAASATPRGSTPSCCASSSCRRALPEDFSGLSIPLTVIASDLYLRREVVFSNGPLRRALAASISLPTIMRPVEVDGQVLVDGGATNPLPFEHLRGRADVIVAVDISGPVSADQREVPNALECLYATVLVMTQLDHQREASPRRAGSAAAAQGRLVPRARLSAGERHPARRRSGEGRVQGKAGNAARRLSERRQRLPPSSSMSPRRPPGWQSFG